MQSESPRHDRQYPSQAMPKDLYFRSQPHTPGSMITHTWFNGCQSLFYPHG